MKYYNQIRKKFEVFLEVFELKRRFWVKNPSQIFFVKFFVKDFSEVLNLRDSLSVLPIVYCDSLRRVSPLFKFGM